VGGLTSLFCGVFLLFVVMGPTPQLQGESAILAELEVHAKEILTVVNDAIAEAEDRARLKAINQDLLDCHHAGLTDAEKDYMQDLHESRCRVPLGLRCPTFLFCGAPAGIAPGTVFVGWRRELI
jgi:hypothetical protein